MTEKYKAMLAQEVETWMDVKRHAYAYPVGMQSIPNVSNTSASKVPVASTYIQRLLYTQSELDKNGTNVPTVTIFSKLPILQ